MPIKPTLFQRTNIFVLMLIFLAPFMAFSQKNDSLNVTKSDTMILDWMIDLYKPGIRLEEDSTVIISEEFSKLHNDKAYRRMMYPSAYSWEAVKRFIQQQELKKAFWFFINLYLIDDKNKELVVKFVLMYDKLFDMEKVLTSTFSTYSLTDPEVGIINENGHSEIKAPHIFEKKQQALKEILFYIQKFRNEEELKKSKK